MDDEEEQLFLERLTLKVWKARAEGAIIGAAFALGIGLLLYLVVKAGPLNPMSSFLYAAMLVMTFLLWQRVFRKPFPVGHSFHQMIACRRLYLTSIEQHHFAVLLKEFRIYLLGLHYLLVRHLKVLRGEQLRN